MDDSKTVTYSLDAENVAEGWLARERPTFIARCSEGDIEAYLVIGMNASVEHGEFQRHTVQLRFDDGKASSMLWNESTDGKALFAASMRVPEVLNSVAASKRLRVGFTPFNANPQIIEFNTAGFREAWEEIQKTCAKRK